MVLRESRDSGIDSVLVEASPGAHFRCRIFCFWRHGAPPRRQPAVINRSAPGAACAREFSHGKSSSPARAARAVVPGTGCQRAGIATETAVKLAEAASSLARAGSAASASWAVWHSKRGWPSGSARHRPPRSHPSLSNLATAFIGRSHAHVLARDRRHIAAPLLWYHAMGRSRGPFLLGEFDARHCPGLVDLDRTPAKSTAGHGRLCRWCASAAA